MADLRILATDLDGTLIHSSGIITGGNRLALDRLREAGVSIVICTGRRHSYALHAVRDLPESQKEVIVSSNGAVVRTGGGGLLWRSTLPVGLVRRLCAALIDFRNSLVLTFDRFTEQNGEGAGALLLEDYDHVHRSIRSWVESNAASIRRVTPLEDAFAAENAEEPIQAMLCGGVERMREAERLLKGSFAAELETFRTEYPARDLSILDIIPCEQSKGSALLRLASSWGVLPSQIAAVGDNWNDEPMFCAAGRSVVLANAPADLLAHAAKRGWHLGAAGDEDGFAGAVDALLREMA